MSSVGELAADDMVMAHALAKGKIWLQCRVYEGWRH